MKLVVGLAALLLAACTATSDDSAAATDDLATAPVQVDRPGHETVHATASTTVNYYGGNVIPNAKVYVVYWGNGSNLAPELTRATGGIADFYAGVLDSPYMDGLSEYSTNRVATAGTHKGQPGSGQIIGRGNYAGTIALTTIPSGTSISDAQIQATIESAINAHTLPTPDDNTLFAIYFPRTVTITIAGSQSCSSFGGYHMQTPANQHHVAYAVLPTCGGGFSSVTSVSSHQLAEAVTDVLPTEGSHPDFPQAWNDSGGNEVADLCTGTGGTLATAKGSFNVQAEWYQSAHGCKVTNALAQDFSLQASSATAAVAAGATTTVTFKTAPTAGAAQALSLSVTAPQGITPTLSTATVTAGDTVTVTLTADAHASIKDGQVVLQATGTSGARYHAASVLVHTGK